jgi:lipopolysaccharide export system protein LptC
MHHLGWLAALASGAALTWWLNNLVVPLPSLPERELRHDPDYSMERFAITEINAGGDTHYRLRADRMDHYPDDGTTRLIKPDLLLYGEEATTYTLNAAEGVATAQNEEIYLNGDVVIKRPATATQEWVRIATRDIVVRHNESYAETKERVVMQDPLFMAQAEGMRLFVKQGRVQLLSGVRSTYAPRDTN